MFLVKLLNLVLFDPKNTNMLNKENFISDFLKSLVQTLKISFTKHIRIFVLVHSTIFSNMNMNTLENFNFIEKEVIQRQKWQKFPIEPLYRNLIEVQKLE